MDKEDVIIYKYIYTIHIYTHTHTHTHTHIYRMDYYSAIKKNETLPFAATWMDLEGIRLSEVSQRETVYNITYMWNLKNTTN